MSFSDFELKQQIVEALHPYHALEISDCDIFNNRDYHIYATMDLLKEEAFRRDAQINVMEIKNTNG